MREGAWEAGTCWELQSCCLLTRPTAQPVSCPLQRDGRTCSDGAGWWLFLKFTPSQNPACTLPVGALPKPSPLGITANPSFAAESSKFIFHLLEWFPEFRDFLPECCYLLESPPMVSFLPSFLAVDFSIKLIEFICLSSMINNKMLILRASESPDQCACLRDTLPSSVLKADNVEGLKHQFIW